MRTIKNNVEPIIMDMGTRQWVMCERCGNFFETWINKKGESLMPCLKCFRLNDEEANKEKEEGMYGDFQREMAKLKNGSKQNGNTPATLSDVRKVTDEMLEKIKVRISAIIDDIMENIKRR